MATVVDPFLMPMQEHWMSGWRDNTDVANVMVLLIDDAAWKLDTILYILGLAYMDV